MDPRHERCVLALERALGPSKVSTERGALEALARDESETEVVSPSAAVFAADEEDVRSALRACYEHGVPVVPRAAGTGRTGGSAVVVPSVLLDTTAMRGLKGVERDDMLAVVAPGLITGVLHDSAEAEGLFYPPDPQSSPSCTLGGNAAENAGGPRALKYGVTREYVLGMRAVTMDGTALELGRRTVKGVTGFDLCALMVGSEGTLAVFTELWLRLVPKPDVVETLLATFATVSDAGRAVSAVVRAGIVPRCMELLDERCCAAVRELEPGALPAGCAAALIVEVDGDALTCEAQRDRVGAALTDAGASEVFAARHGGERERLWSARRVLSRALRRTAANKLSEDVVVPRSKLAALLDAVREISERERITMPTYGHAGDGNLHVNLLWNHAHERPAVDRAIRALFERTIALGGTLSGEHGIGALKRDFLSLEQREPVIEAQRAIKSALDPRGLLNPHKVLPARAGHRAC